MVQIMKEMSMFAVKTEQELNDYIESLTGQGEKQIAYLIYGLTWNMIASKLNKEYKEDKEE